MARRRWGRKAAKADYPYVWTLGVRPAGRKGQRCRIVSGKKSPVCLVQFSDGRQFHVQRSGLAKAEA